MPPARGEPPPPKQPDTLAGVVRRHARERSGRVAMTFLERGERPAEEETFAGFDGAARRVAGFLRGEGLAGRPVLVAVGPGLDFVRCFLGCLYAGAIAVPVPAVAQRRARARIAAILADVGPAAILTEELAAADQAWLTATLREGDLPVRQFAVGAALAAREIDAIAAADFDDPAFIQYTSGSTSRPKGVVVTHRNMMANLAMIGAAFGPDERPLGVSWLPHYHDMGLIGCILHPLHIGEPMVLMSPLAFLQQPIRWLRAVSTHRATISGAPNFGYDICVRHLRPEQLAGLDLSCWRVAVCGAEPIRFDTMARFAEMLEPVGFRREAIFPSYGLAEATLLATGVGAGEGMRHREFPRPGGSPRRVVSCGRPFLGARVAIVDPERDRPMPPDAVGEICVGGDNVSPGFWSGDDRAIVPDVGRAVMVGGEPCLRSGDLGALIDGETYVVGRLKDMIIARGMKICAEDVEDTIAGLDRNAPLTAAAFALDGERGEAMAVVCEMRRGDPRATGAAPLLAEIRDAVAEAHGILLADVALVLPSAIPRAASGKIRRGATRERYLSGDMAVLASLGETQKTRVPSDA